MTDYSEIDVDFNFFDDTPDGKDPDSHSPTLRRYHQLLWSKELPDGRRFILESKSLSPYLVYQSESQRFVLGSDTVLASGANSAGMEKVALQTGLDFINCLVIIVLKVIW